MNKVYEEWMTDLIERFEKKHPGLSWNHYRRWAEWTIEAALNDLGDYISFNRLEIV